MKNRLLKVQTDTETEVISIYCTNIKLTLKLWIKILFPDGHWDIGCLDIENGRFHAVEQKPNEMYFFANRRVTLYCKHLIECQNSFCWIQFLEVVAACLEDARNWRKTKKVKAETILIKRNDQEKVKKHENELAN